LQQLEERVGDAAVFDRLSLGVVVLSQYGRVLGMNRAACILLTGTGPTGSEGFGSMARLSRADSTAFNNAVNGLKRETVRRRGFAPVSIPARATRLRLSAIVVPFAGQPDPVLPEAPAALGLVYGDAMRWSIAPHLIQTLYQLTAREAAFVAALVETLKLNLAAERLGVRMSTARTYMKHAMSKMFVRRQPDLIRKVIHELGPLSLPLDITSCAPPGKRGTPTRRKGKSNGGNTQRRDLPL
jgi:hypothetical protein